MGSVDQEALQTVSSTVAPTKRKSQLASRRILIKHLPKQVTSDDVHSLVATFGDVRKFELGTGSGDTCFVSVAYETSQQAQHAYDQLNNSDYHGTTLKVDYVRGVVASGNGRRAEAPSTVTVAIQRCNAYPLRILVPSEYVGAIIGKKGASIKSITTKCKARVDVHGKENSGLIEQIISIYGQPENCSSACREILQVIQQESAPPSLKTELPLKMLADDRFCGRLIGKEGRMIKKICEETSTKIVVTNVQEMAALYPYRVISIRGGSIESVVKAELAISCKLAECIEHDIKANPGCMSPQVNQLNFVFGSLPSSQQYGGLYSPGLQFVGAATVTRSLQTLGGGAPGSGEGLEISQIQVLNSAVGAIIGVGGANIKQIMRDSGAFITVEQRPSSELSPCTERLVTVRGTTDSCWRASYYIFEKIRSECLCARDNVRLVTLVRVPRCAVGRIIGQGGRTVRDIQHLTGAVVKLPHGAGSVQGGSASGGAQGGGAQGGEEEAVVEIHGNFMSTQNAQSRVRALVTESILSSRLTSVSASGLPVYGGAMRGYGGATGGYGGGSYRAGEGGALPQ